MSTSGFRQATETYPVVGAMGGSWWHTGVGALTGSPTDVPGIYERGVTVPRLVGDQGVEVSRYRGPAVVTPGGETCLCLSLQEIVSPGVR